MALPSRLSTASIRRSLTTASLLHRVTSTLQQIRHAQVHDVRFLQTRIEPRIADKYKDLLEKKAKRSSSPLLFTRMLESLNVANAKLTEGSNSEGLSSVEELRETYKHKINAYKQKSAALPEVAKYLDPLLNDAPPTASSLPKRAAKIVPTKIPSTNTGVKTLASYIDVDKIVLHDNPKEIELIWRARHVEDPTSICAVIPADVYKRIEKAAKRHPMFILPLPRPSQGIEMHFLQWQFASPDTVNVMFTPLVEYKLKGEYASPHTTITHHLEILPKKGVVLLQGQVVENRGVSVDEASWLLMALQKFYGASEEKEEGRRRLELLRLFTEGKTEFDVQELIREVETIN